MQDTDFLMGLFDHLFNGDDCMKSFKKFLINKDFNK